MSGTPYRLKMALVIDDDRIISGLASAFLEKRTETVFTVSNGLQALEKLKIHKNEIEFILCDLQMPEIDGLQFLRFLSSAHYKGPIAVLSGVEPALLQLAQTIAGNYQLNMIGALEKPLNVKELGELLDRTFAQPSSAKSSLNNKTAGITKQERPPLGADDLRQALLRKQIALHYQPQFDARTIQVIGVEALPIWEHPDFDTIAPEELTSLAEESGLIPEVTEYILKIISWDARRWSDVKSDFRTSINLSGAALSNVELPDRLAFLMRCNAIEKTKLVLEIAESKLLLWDATSLEVLARLKLHGFELAIDDFGTTYSTMEEIREFPFNELKIDRSFVSDVQDNPKSTTIIEACIQLCRKNNIRSVATGVETKQELTHLVRKGIDIVQGPLFGQPMPIESGLSWLDQHIKKSLQKK